VFDKDDDLLSVGLTSCQFQRAPAQEFLNQLRIQFRFVYVISSSSDVYHLPEVSQDATLCGLRLAPIIINRPVSTSTLYLTEEAPNDRQLCDDCARIDAARTE
jgi:hypothetical protein